MFPGFGRKNVVKGPRNESLPLTHDGLPDSYKPNGLCPRCGKQSSFEMIGEIPVTYSDFVSEAPNGKHKPHYYDRVISMRCRHCNQCVVVIEEEWTNDQPSRLAKSGGIVSFRGIHWWPLPYSKPSSDIPQEIADVYVEAMTTYYAQAPRATAVMLRITLEAITVKFDEKQGVLSIRLKNMAQKGILQPQLAEWAKEIRLIGNVGGHFDPAESVSMDEAKQLLSFTEELLKYLFELPAELERLRKQT